MKLFSKIRDNLFSIFQTALIGLLVVLVVIFGVVMFPENPEWIFNLLGVAEKGEPKYEALKSQRTIANADPALANARRRHPRRCPR